MTMMKNEIISGFRRFFSSFIPAIVMVCLMTGCQTTNTGTENKAGSESETTGSDLKITGVGSSSYMKALNLLVMPKGVYLDAQKGADAVAVQLFAQPTEAYKFKYIQKGTLELIVLDGYVQHPDDKIPPILQTWRYAPKDLKKYEKKTAVGESYEILLVWDKDKQPTAEKVTVLARYIDPKGKAIYSEPGVVIL